MMNEGPGSGPAWQYGAIAIAGLLLAMLGLAAMAMTMDGTSFQAQSLLLAGGLLLLAGGGVLGYHASQAHEGKPSRPMRLPHAVLFVGVFALCVAVAFGAFSGLSAALFGVMLLMSCIAMPLASVAWFAGARPLEVTWRHGVLSWLGGATVGVLLAIVLEVLFPALLVVLVLSLGERALDLARATLSGLAGRDVAEALASPGFVYVLVQLAVVAPLAEELVKPLAVLPLIRRLSRRDAFLAAALAGAGFSAVEDLLYASFAIHAWGGILLVRALGAALHPVCAGLVGLAWRDVLQRESGAWRRAVKMLAAAVGLHAVWNGGSLLVITLGQAGFFGALPAEIDVLGTSAAGTTLAFLLVLGIAALWLGRRVASRADEEQPAAEVEAIPSDRTAALWALACLAAFVPAGITGLRLMLR